MSRTRGSLNDVEANNAAMEAARGGVVGAAKVSTFSSTIFSIMYLRLRTSYQHHDTVASVLPTFGMLAPSEL